MSLSLFLARFFALYFLIIGIFYLTRGKYLRTLIPEFIQNQPLILVTGILSLIIGLLIVLSHNVWEPNCKTLITLIGYIAVFKGFMRLFTPEAVQKTLLLKMNKKEPIIYIGIFCLIIGLLLVYEGFL